MQPSYSVSEHPEAKVRRTGNATFVCILKAASAALLLSLVCPTTSGQQAIKVPLTIKQAVQLALRQNPVRLAAGLIVTERRQDQTVAHSALLPQAALTAAQGVTRFNMQSIIGGPKPVRVGPFQAIAGGPLASQSLFNLPLLREYQASREDVRGAESQESATREQIAALVVAQYLSVLKSTADRDAATARVTLAERLVEQASQLQKNEISTNIDTLRAQVELQNEEQRLIDAETQRNAAIYALGQVLDLPFGQEPEATDAMEFSALPQFSIQDLVDQARLQRPELKVVASEERATELRRKAAADQRWPSLQVSALSAYQARRPDDGLGAYGYVVSLKVPLWTSGRIAAEEEKTKLEQQRIAEQRREIESVVEQQVKTALDQLKAARKSVDVAALGLQLAHEEVEHAQRRFQAGVTTNIEVVTAQDALARADDNNIEALYRFNRSRAELARSVGNVEDVYGR